MTRSIGGSIERPSLRSLMSNSKTETIISVVNPWPENCDRLVETESTILAGTTPDNCNFEYGGATRLERRAAVNA